MRFSRCSPFCVCVVLACPLLNACHCIEMCCPCFYFSTTHHPLCMCFNLATADCAVMSPLRCIVVKLFSMRVSSSYGSAAAAYMNRGKMRCIHFVMQGFFFLFIVCNNKTFIFLLLILLQI